MRIGYSRVSTVDQDPELQIRALEDAHCDRIYTDHASGNARKRPELDRLFETLRAGDTLVVWRFDRLGRSVSHLVQLIEQLHAKQIELTSLTEGIDTKTPIGEAMFTIFAAVAQMERQLNSERTRAGIAKHRKNKNRWGASSKFHDPDTVKLAMSLLRDGGLSKPQIARQIGVCTSTLYRWFPSGDPDNFQKTPTFHRRQRQKARR
ncbi:MAG: recombinase family protein [Bryobacterales bacterium]|nr:recombinase family protein [Bryobacterales bacterium]MDE0295846.1 recombinase family protein [Bryobacterales bacterium]